MVHDVALLKTQYYKVRIKVKVEQSRKGVASSLHLSIVANERGTLRSPSTTVVNFTF